MTCATECECWRRSPAFLLRGGLVVLEVAATLVLLIGAGLLIKSFIRLHETDLGFKAENVLTMSLALPQAKYPDAQAAAAFHQKLVERVASLPGARSAGVINYLPLQQWGFNGDIAIEGQGPFEPGRGPLALKVGSSAPSGRKRTTMDSVPLGPLL